MFGSIKKKGDDEDILPIVEHMRNDDLKLIKGSEIVGFYGYKVRVGKLGYSKITIHNLSSIFNNINRYTCSSPYSDPNGYMYDVTVISEYGARTKIYRPNHNGTHSCRQGRNVEMIFDMIQKIGKNEIQELVKKLSKNDFFNILLSAFTLRSGRVNESYTDSANFDEKMGERSAMIYEYYAKQLTESISQEMRDSTVKVMINLYYNPEEHEEDEESTKIYFTKNEYFLKQVLTCSHTMDLVRCYTPPLFEKKAMYWMKQYIKYFVDESKTSEDVSNDDEIIKKMLDFAISLCKRTGSMLRFLSKYDYDSKFVKHSENGKFCWKSLKKQKFPMF